MKRPSHPALVLCLLFSPLAAQFDTSTDSTALVALYTSLDGPNWTIKTNWLVPGTDLDSWHGVNLTNGRVTYLALANNNLSGTIPAEIGNFTALVQLFLHTNQITGAVPDTISNLTSLANLHLYDNQLDALPDLSALTALTAMNVRDNQFTFEDVEQLAGMSIANLTYAPQDSVGTAMDTVVVDGTSLLMSILVGGGSNLYQWSLDGTDITGATDDTLIISAVTYPSDYGTYALTVTNSVATALTLHGRPISVRPDITADSLALVDLYNSTGGTAWNAQAGWLTSSLADWDGVTITNGRVTGLNFYDNNLTGAVPASIGNLTGLTSLRLWYNALTSIPAQMGNLGNLEELGLSKNQIAAIPAELYNLTNLKDLYLSDNLLTSLPAGIGAMVNLKNLGLRRNQLTTFDPGTTGLDSLTTLDLSGNQISQIPTTIGNLHVLTTLSLSSNLLTTIPTEVGTLTGLTNLYLDVNQLTALPSGLGSLVNLTNLSVGYNLLTSLPSELGSLAKLEGLTLSSNQLTTLPTTFGGLTNLITLYLDINLLTTLPGELGSMTSLKDLYINKNQLSSLPTGIGGLASLRNLDMSSNQFTLIPTELLNLTGLETLQMNDNQITGGIPPEIGNLTGLVHLGLGNNRITGSIPAAMGSLDSLKRLWLFNNQLEGVIPDTLGSMPKLESLLLSGNRLSGTIPSVLGKDTSLVELWLSGNELTGAVPAEIADLKHLYYLTLDNNQLENLPDLSAMPALTELHLQNNRFTFEAIEPNVNLATGATLQSYQYSPQDSVGSEEMFTISAGSNITLQVTMGGSSTTYQWMMNGADIAGATTESYAITSATHDDGGVYHLRATNTVATGLELISRAQIVLAPNEPPVAPPDTMFSIPTMNALALTVSDLLASASDADGDSLYISDFKTTRNGDGWMCTRPCGESPKLVYQSRPGFAGTDTLEYIISDGHYGKATARVIVTNTPSDPSWGWTPVIGLSQIYGGEGDDRGYSVLESADGAYIVAGSTTSKGAGGTDALLMKIDAAGDTIWTKTFGSTGEDMVYAVQQTTDGGYILAGESESDGWLIKTGSNGSVIWDAIYGQIGTGREIGTGRIESRGAPGTAAASRELHHFTAVLQTRDGGYIAAGRRVIDVTADSSDAWLIKTDGNGVEQWSKTFGGSDLDAFYGIDTTSDGGYILIGETRSTGAGGRDMWLIKTDDSGVATWEKTFGGNGNEIGYSVQQTTDGGYILVGSTEPFQTWDSDAWIIKTDGSGITSWTETVAYNGNNAAHSVRQTAGGGYIVAGYTDLGHQDATYWAMEMDALGNSIIWNFNALGGWGIDKAFDVAITSMGKFILIGYTESYSVGGEDIWLMILGGNLLGIADGPRPANLPREFALHPNYPNPFNPSTTLQFDLPESVDVTLKVYDLLGREVVELIGETYTAGYHGVRWDGRDKAGRQVPTGLYIARLVAGEYSKAIKMVLLK